MVSGVSSRMTAADARWDLAGARGAARAALATAQTAAGRARQERDECRRTYEARLARLAARREGDLRRATEGFRERALGLGRALDALAARSAPGAAGSSWRTWRPTEPAAARRRPANRAGGRVRGGGPGRFPGRPDAAATPAALLRIGAIHVERPLPALVPLLDRAHLWLSGPDPAAVDGVIAGLLLRALGSTAPGDLRLTVYDPERLGGALAAFAPLAAAGLVTYVGPGQLDAVLDDLVTHIGRVNGLLGGEHANLADLAETRGRRPEPWRVAVLLADAATAAELTGAQGAQLARIARAGAACGVHLVVRGLPAPDHPAVHRIAVHPTGDGGTVGTATTTGDLPVRLDPPPPADRVAVACRDLADRVLAGPPPAEFEDLQPEHPWAESAAAGLIAPLGDGPDGDLVAVALGDDVPHALVAGPSGAGKTNLVHAWLAALCSRYAPDELVVHLLDLSGGGSFARFAPTPDDPSWLPQARTITIGADRGPAVAVLRDLAGELHRRAAAAARCGAAKLAELRTGQAGGAWPRILAVVDEFPALLAGADALATEAADLLADLVRRGRAQGVHLLLVGQDVTGLAGLAAQFPLRVALPRAHGVLASTNLAAEVIPRFHAVVNADSGAPTGNRVVRPPDAADRDAWRRLQERLWAARPAGLAPPRLIGRERPAPPAPPAARALAAAPAPPAQPAARALAAAPAPPGEVTT